MIVALTDDLLNEAYNQSFSTTDQPKMLRLHCHPHGFQSTEFDFFQVNQHLSWRLNYFLYFLTPTSILCKESGSWEHYYEKQLINWAKNAFWTIFRTIMHELREERSNNRNKHLSPRVYLNQYIRFPHKTLHHEQNVRDEQFVQDQGLMEIFIEAPHSLPASW